MVTDATGVDHLLFVLLDHVFHELLTRLKPEETELAGQAVLFAHSFPVQHH